MDKVVKLDTRSDLQKEVDAMSRDIEIHLENNLSYARIKCEVVKYYLNQGLSEFIAVALANNIYVE